MATKLLKAKIKNFKNIKDFEVEPNGHNFWLIGENGRGKTSFQQLLKIAMGDAASIPPNMIADGHFWLDKDGQEYKSKVEAKNGKVTIKVTLPDGVIEDKKTVIRALFGGVDFNVQQFVEWSKTAEGRRKQVAEFKAMLPDDAIEIINNLEKEIDNRYKDRTAINQKVDSLKGYIKECKLYGDDLKVQPVDVTAINAELEKANTFNTKVRDIKKRAEDREKSITEKEAKIEALKAEIAELERVTEVEKTVQKDALKWIAEKGIEINTASLVEQINNASEINVKAQQAKEQLDRMKKLESFEAEAENFTVEIELKREAIRDCIRDIDSPVQGLTYEGETLLYNGNPVDSNVLSTSEIFELGFKLAIAKNPDCGILFVQQGESIGNERLKMMKELADKNGWQIIAECVVRGKESLEMELMVD
jgi:predicted ATP-dependent endonuclease of OLD family